MNPCFSFSEAAKKETNADTPKEDSSETDPRQPRKDTISRVHEDSGTVKEDDDTRRNSRVESDPRESGGVQDDYANYRDRASEDVYDENQNEKDTQRGMEKDAAAKIQGSRFNSVLNLVSDRQ